MTSQTPNQRMIEKAKEGVLSAAEQLLNLKTHPDQPLDKLSIEYHTYYTTVDRVTAEDGNVPHIPQPSNVDRAVKNILDIAHTIKTSKPEELTPEVCQELLSRLGNIREYRSVTDVPITSEMELPLSVMSRTGHALLLESDQGPHVAKRMYNPGIETPDQKAHSMAVNISNGIASLAFRMSAALETLAGLPRHHVDIVNHGQATGLSYAARELLGISASEQQPAETPRPWNRT